MNWGGLRGGMKINSELLKHYIDTLFKFDNDLITKKTILRIIKLIEEYEEEKEAKSKPTPGIFSLIFIAIICLGYSISNVMDITEGIFSNIYEAEHFFKVIVPDLMGILTLLVCSILIAIMAYNVKKKKIFTRTNAILIYAIGAIIIFSVVIQNHY